MALTIALFAPHWGSTSDLTLARIPLQVAMSHSAFRIVLPSV